MAAYLAPELDCDVPNPGDAPVDYQEIKRAGQGYLYIEGDQPQESTGGSTDTLTERYQAVHEIRLHSSIGPATMYTATDGVGQTGGVDNKEYHTVDVSELAPSNSTSPSASPSSERQTHSSSPKQNTPPSSEPPSISVRAWNEEFQAILELPDSREKFTRLSRLAHDFVYTAETYGRIIINELGMPLHLRTIKPIAAGGAAGGTKYICQGIFYKFALDTHNLYGGDQWAIKVAKHDLAGLTYYYGCHVEGVHFPLMALIDYRGFRLIAISILPINSYTLCYGSADAGLTVHTDSMDVNNKMLEIARQLNLKEHYVGFREMKRIAGPADIEGHIGTDARVYIVDFARVFPPEAFSREQALRQKGRHMFKLLRPEFVLSYPIPLCSDAFSAFIMQDPEMAVHNREVREATDHLHHHTIPMFAALLDSRDPLESPAVDTVGRICDELHAAGINIRHLGRVRQYVTSPVWRRLLLIEMCARVIKNQFRHALREGIYDGTAATSEEAAKAVTAALFNRVFGDPLLWQRPPTAPDGIKGWLVLAFDEMALFDEEAVDEYDLRTSLDWLVLTMFQRIQQLTGVRLSHQAIAELDEISHRDASGKELQYFRFVDVDIERFDTRVTHMVNLITISEARALHYVGCELAGREGTRVLALSLAKLKKVLSNRGRARTVHSVAAAVELGREFLRRALHADGCTHTSKLIELAKEALQLAALADPANLEMLCELGRVYAKQGDMAAAEAAFTNATAVDPTNPLPDLYWGDVLVNSLTKDFEGAVEKFQSASAKAAARGMLSVSVHALIKAAAAILRNAARSGSVTAETLLPICEQLNTAFAQLGADAPNALELLPWPPVPKAEGAARQETRVTDKEMWRLLLIIAARLPIVGAEAQRRLSGATAIDFGGCQAVDDEFVTRVIPQFYPTGAVALLDLSGCRAVTDVAMATTLTRYSPIAALHINYYKAGEATQHTLNSGFAAGLRQLRWRALTAPAVDDWLPKLAGAYTRLEVLDLRGLDLHDRLTNQAIAQVGKLLPRLRELQLNGCKPVPAITPAGFEGWTTDQLAVVSLQSSAEISVEVLKAGLFKRWPSTLTYADLRGFGAGLDEALLRLCINPRDKAQLCPALRTLVLPSGMPLVFAVNRSNPIECSVFGAQDTETTAELHTVFVRKSFLNWSFTLDRTCFCTLTRTVGDGTLKWAHTPSMGEACMTAPVVTFRKGLATIGQDQWMAQSMDFPSIRCTKHKLLPTTLTIGDGIKWTLLGQPNIGQFTVSEVPSIRINTIESMPSVTVGEHGCITIAVLFLACLLVSRGV